VLAVGRKVEALIIYLEEFIRNAIKICSTFIFGVETNDEVILYLTPIKTPMLLLKLLVLKHLSNLKYYN